METADDAGAAPVIAVAGATGHVGGEVSRLPVRTPGDVEALTGRAATGLAATLREAAGGRR